MNWQRARTEENKSTRKEAIFNAAFSLFKSDGYEKVSFNNIAVTAGFTKSNMYRYFSSKEEIFLNIFAYLFEQWFDEYNLRLSKMNKNEDIDLFVKQWVDSYLDNPQLLDLMPILFTSLEKNSSYEQLLAFKRLSKHLLYQITLQISRIYPDIQVDKAFKFLTLSYAATSNQWAANSQNEALKKIYQQEEFLMLKPNFEEDLTSSIKVIINGLKAD